VTSDDTPKRFDCVKFMREARARIDAEIKDMTHEELQTWLDAGPRQYPLWKGMRDSRPSAPAKTRQDQESGVPSVL